MKIRLLSFLLSIGLVTVISPLANAKQITSLPTSVPPETLLLTQAGRSVIDFEDLTLSPNSFYNGSDGAGGFTSRGAFFSNSYNPTYQSWSGWSYSNTTDTTTPGFTNQYSAITGGGFDGPNSNYGVAFTFNPGDAYINLPTGKTPKSIRITNTTYAVQSMLNGDQFAKKFGGVSGNDPDFFLLTITGLNNANQVIGTVNFYLADYRFTDNSQDYILTQWQRINLSGLSGATKLSFMLTSSDNGPYGMNTPAYFAADYLEVVPLP